MTYKLSNHNSNWALPFEEKMNNKDCKAHCVVWDNEGNKLALCDPTIILSYVPLTFEMTTRSTFEGYCENCLKGKS